MKLAVLGGSSPFTIALIDALVPHMAAFPSGEIALHGRNTERLELIGEYAQARLSSFGWTVRATTDMEEVLRDASFVLHQIRYGGMALRRAGELLCERVGCHADETLGPAALLTAMRLRKPLELVSERIKMLAPRAAVVNLTNPLSVTTSWMHRHGVQNILGACELPFVSALQIAAYLRIDFAHLDWSYTGLNHRGFLHGLDVDGGCALTVLANQLDEGHLDGVSAEMIRGLGAVPTKYFRLLTLPLAAEAPARAKYLQSLQVDVIAELRCNGHVRPRSLERRYLGWYPHAVVPLLVALSAATSRRELVNSVDDDGITRERFAIVSSAGIEAVQAPPLPAAARVWLERFERHERTLLDGFGRPTRDWLHETLALDPLGGGATQDVADAVWNHLRSLQHHGEQ